MLLTKYAIFSCLIYAIQSGMQKVSSRTVRNTGCSYFEIYSDFALYAIGESGWFSLVLLICTSMSFGSISKMICSFVNSVILNVVMKNGKKNTDSNLCFVVLKNRVQSVPYAVIERTVTSESAGVSLIP